MDTFDGSKPNLISSKTIKELESKLNDLPVYNDSNKIFNGLETFYENYIMPNMFPLIVITLLILYLIIKYILKKDRDEKEDIKHVSKKNVINIHAKDYKKYDISDMISDEYLLTEDKDIEKDRDSIVDDYSEVDYPDVEYPDSDYSDEKIEINNNDIDKAANIIFGKNKT